MNKSRRLAQRQSAVSLCAILIVLCSQWSCTAIPLWVYSNNDDGAGSLRQRIADNIALGGGNTILFSNVVTGTITLLSELVISNDVTIAGPGAKILTLSGNNASRVFNSAATIGGTNGLYEVAAEGSGTTIFLNITQAGDPVAYVGSVLGTPLPRLNVSQTTSNTVVVSWPSLATGWNLRQSTNLGAPNWVTPAESVNNNGTVNYIVVSPPASNRFYLLSKP